jgi:hypothetical protein
MNNFFKTLKQLFSHPTDVIDTFVMGGRGEYMHPFLFSFTLALLIVVLNTLFVDFNTEFPELDIGPQNEQLVEMTNTIRDANLRAITQFLPVTILLLLIPSLSLAGTFFFKENTDGFYHNLILNTYTAGASLLSLLCMIPVWMIIDLPLTDPLMNSTLPAVLVAGVILWIYKEYIRISSWMGWLKMVSSYIVGYVLFTILAGFAASVAGYMIYVINRLAEISF